MTRYTDPVATLLPTGALDVLKTVAAGKHASLSQYVRQAVMGSLKADGAEFKTDAGALYNVVEGQSMFALVEAGRIVSMGYQSAKPDDGRQWLSVVFEDSEPFDPDKHWRLSPIDRLDGDRVVRHFPVVPKSLEHC